MFPKGKITQTENAKMDFFDMYDHGELNFTQWLTYVLTIFIEEVECKRDYKKFMEFYDEVFNNNIFLNVCKIEYNNLKKEYGYDDDDYR